jgi:quinoprotein glucose dehydrogenase
VYNIDWPSFYETLEIREATPAGSDGPAPPPNPFERGGTLYSQYCQVCHGSDRAGSGNAPSLLDTGRRLSFGDVRHVILTGRGEMPAFPALDSAAIADLYRYLAGMEQPAGPPRSATSDELPDGPVVAAGGAPGSQQIRQVVGGGGGRLGAPYPEGVDAPSVRYYIAGYGLGFSYVIRPPWATITAYDLNTGTIRWQRPVGTDRHAVREGAHGTGVPQAQRNGMVVTSTGILFSTAKDGNVYAFDADDGRELWSGQLPMGTEGIPAMYEVDGRHHLVVTATTPLRWGRGQQDEEEANAPRPQGGYVVFALPRNGASR